ncbi:hypothetical protein MUP77_04590 [Candidatus Bathyarchaeota archaeon]|nr:hypothetical protein [Candidatus Bathyarchaeota archaeon]
MNEAPTVQNNGDDFIVTYPNFLVHFKAGNPIQIQLFKDTEPLTSSITLDTPEKLKTSPLAKVFRGYFVEEFKENSPKELEHLVMIIQSNNVTEQPNQQQEECVQQYIEPEDIRAEVDALITSQNLLEALKHYLDCVLVGEDANKLCIFILLLGGKTKDPSLVSTIILKGEPGGGKTVLIDLADLFNTKVVGRFTEHAMDYSDLGNYDVLKIKELGYMDVENEEHGLSTLKFLSSDDEGYTVEYPIRDPETGKFVTVQNKIPPITVITSTARISTERQLDRRSFIESPDESQEQTLRILNWKAINELEKGKVALGLMQETSEQHANRVLKAFVNRLRPMKVILPFPKSLMSVLQSEKLRVRGDYDKIVTLVKLYTLANQQRLHTIEIEDNEAVVVTPKLAIEILKVASTTLTTMMTDLEPRLIRLLDVLEECEKDFQKNKKKEFEEEQTKLLEEHKSKEVQNFVFEIDEDVVVDIAKRLERSKKTVQWYFDKLCDSGLMSESKDHFDKRKKVFKLMSPLSEIKMKIGTLSIAGKEDTYLNAFKAEGKEVLKAIRDMRISIDVLREFL